MRKPTMWFRNRSYTKQPVQAQEMARQEIFYLERKGILHSCSENKGADQYS